MTLGSTLLEREVRSPTVSDSVSAWERQLVARIVAGDDAAVAVVYDQYSALVHGIAVRMVGRDSAVDICQEVFVALWKSPERWDPAVSTLRSFLAMIARRRCIDLLRRKGRHVEQYVEPDRAMAPAVPNVDEAAIAALAGERVRDALAELPALQRQAIELAYFQGLTFRQVAVATGATEGTAKSRIRIGLQRLAEQLGPIREVTTA